MNKRTSEDNGPPLKASRSINSGIHKLNLDTPRTSESSIEMNNLPLAIGSNTERQENGPSIVQQARIQMNNPSLPASVKQQLFQTIVQVDAFGDKFSEAPVPVYNMLILQIKACLAHAIGGHALAQHQIRTAYCDTFGLEAPAPPRIQHNSSGHSRRPSKKSRSKKQ
jgi:hypothetical protein